MASWSPLCTSFRIADKGLFMTDTATAPAKGDLFSKFDPIIETRETLLASGVEDPYNLVMEKVLSPTRAICNGRDTILLGTYNYMGMTFDPDDVIAAGKDALENFGSGHDGQPRSQRHLSGA